MEIFEGIEPLKAYLGTKRKQNLSIGLVPTMGALHDGHISLIQASKLKNDLTVCSIYVNPTQFNNNTDLEKYPRQLDRDAAMLVAAECDVLFAPSNSEMYATPNELKMDFGPLDKILEGKFRPGHFSGVGVVVGKLFNIVKPDRAYFGQKDFQQFAIISKLVSELLFDIELHAVPIKREADGLAMSSRNLRLNKEQRENAVIFYQQLLAARDGVLRKEPWTRIEKAVKENCERIGGVQLEYISLADVKNLNPIENVYPPDQAVILIAGYVGDVRLIDNILLHE